VFRPFIIKKTIDINTFYQLLFKNPLYPVYFLMKIEKKYWIIFLIAFFLSFKLYSEVIPTPQKTTFKEGVFKITEKIRISLTNDTQTKNLYAAELINTVLKKIFQINSYLEADPKDAQILLIFIDEKKAQEAQIPSHKLKEGYRIVIDAERIRIEAVNPQGIFYGAQTLVQLFQDAGASKTLKAQEIIDYPNMDVRAVSDDISRGQISNLQNFKKIIQNLAHYKLNTYMLYIEDMLKFEQYPDIGRERDALEKKEVRELIEYAQKHFIEIIPIFQTFAHQENILGLEPFQNLAEFPGAMCFNTSELTYKYLENTLKEIAQLFPSAYIHIGGDESFDAGIGKSQAQAKQLGMGGLHALHYKKVYDICKKFNKQVMMYGDMLLKYPEVLKQIPKDIIIVDWHLKALNHYPSVDFFKNAGFVTYVSPTTYSHKTMFPLHLNSMPLIEGLIKTGEEYSLKGMVNANWGDMGAETPKELLYYAYAWSANCSWNLANATMTSFNQSFFYDFFGTKSPYAEQVYRTLSQPLNNIAWNELWKHPLLPYKPTGFWQAPVDISSRWTMIDWDKTGLRLALDSLKKNARQNIDHIDILNLNYQILEYYSLKLKTVANYQNFMQAKKGNIEDLINQTEANIQALQKLKENYTKIWNLYYRPAGLAVILKKFDRLLAYFEEAKDNLIGEKLPNPLIKSQWIYVCADSVKCYRDAIFRKDFELKEIPEFAFIQIAADTYAELKINDIDLKATFVRNIFSGHLEPQVIKLVNIRDILHLGANYIQITVSNYNQGLKNLNLYPVSTGAGVNVWAYFKGEKQEFYIYSDKDWVGKNWETKNLTLPFGKVVTHPYRFELTSPDPRTERASVFEK
jgi:hexosaminidase